jgi:lysophospholipase L1-like esterase
MILWVYLPFTPKVLQTRLPNIFYRHRQALFTSTTLFRSLGDSYISGEGAFQYLEGTDTDGNHCHVSLVSYPALLGHDLNYNSYHSVACSGATTNDVTNISAGYKGQAKPNTEKSKFTQIQISSILSNFQQGYIDQLDFVKQYEPKVITLSVGGNDVGMISKLKSCINPGTCFSSYEDRLEFVREVNSKFNSLVDTYDKLKNAGSPDMRIYVVGYPQIAKPDGDCALNVHLNNDEIIFTTQAINYLDGVLKAATAKAGVFYVDDEDAFYGHRFCEAGPGSVAMNGVTAGNDIPARFGGPIGSESFHPNPFGYQLLENKILEATHKLTDPMPEANLLAALPAEAGLEILNAPHSGRAVNSVEYDNGLAQDLAYRQVPIDISIDGAAHSLAPGTTLQVELHSTPVSLGSLTADVGGSISTQITIPEDVPAGYHIIHFYGTDLSGRPVDIYKDIYLANTADDLDGNGILDSTQRCLGIEESGQDFDQDGTDDACDGSITQPPAALTTTVVSGSVSAGEDNLIVSNANPATGLTGGQPNSIINSPTFTNHQVTQSQPTVLGASTTESSPVHSDNLRVPNFYFAGAGLSVFVLSALAYAIKSWLF